MVYCAVLHAQKGVFEKNMSMRQWKRQIRNDIRTDILEKWYYEAILFVIIFFVCLQLYMEIKNMGMMKEIGSLSWADYLLCLYKGIGIKEIQAERLIVLPTEWLMIQIGFVFRTAFYPYKSFHAHGYQYLMRTDSKLDWWLSKISCVMLHALLWHGIIILVCLLFAVAGGNPSLQNHMEFLEMMGVGNGIYVKNVWVFFLPVLFSITVGVFQAVVGILISPIVSIILILVYTLLGVFCSSELFLSNYSMLVRCNLIDMQLGVSVWIGICLFFIVNVGMISVGYYFFKQKEVV